MKLVADAIIFILMIVALAVVFVAVAGGCICDHFLEVKIVEPRISLLATEGPPEPTLTVEVPDESSNEVVGVPER